jgi:ribosomal protein S8E
LVKLFCTLVLSSLCQAFKKKRVLGSGGTIRNHVVAGISLQSDTHHTVSSDCRELVSWILYEHLLVLICFSGNIRVYCRVRPFLTYELGRPTTVDYIGENGEMVLVNPSKPGGGKETRRTFTFNKVFGTTASQGVAEIFQLLKIYSQNPREKNVLAARLMDVTLCVYQWSSSHFLQCSEMFYSVKSQFL